MSTYYTPARATTQALVAAESTGETPPPSPIDPDAITEFNITGIVAIACLTALEVTALITGHDGAFLLPCAALIGGLAGYKIPAGLFGGK